MHMAQLYKQTQRAPAPSPCCVHMKATPEMASSRWSTEPCPTLCCALALSFPVHIRRGSSPGRGGTRSLFHAHSSQGPAGLWEGSLGGPCRGLQVVLWLLHHSALRSIH